MEFRWHCIHRVFPPFSFRSSAFGCPNISVSGRRFADVRVSSGRRCESFVLLFCFCFRLLTLVAELAHASTDCVCVRVRVATASVCPTYPNLFDVDFAQRTVFTLQSVRKYNPSESHVSCTHVHCAACARTGGRTHSVACKCFVICAGKHIFPLHSVFISFDCLRYADRALAQQSANRQTESNETNIANNDSTCVGSCSSVLLNTADGGKRHHRRQVVASPIVWNE